MTDDTEELDKKGPFDRLTRKAALMVLLISLPFLFVLTALGYPAMGRAAAISVAAIVTTAIICWDSRRHLWFWITLSILILLHVPLILFVPWSNNNYPGVALLPQALLDFAITCGCINLVAKLMKRTDEASSLE